MVELVAIVELCLKSNTDFRYYVILVGLKLTRKIERVIQKLPKMSTKKELKRTKQCKNCPWKVSTNPFDIPDGYCELKHKNLEKTIATGISLDFSKPINAMACHHSKDTGENAEHCVGWLVHQLGEGNNIPLRMSMRNYSNSGELKTYGEQHKRFEDTLPENKNYEVLANSRNTNKDGQTGFEILEENDPDFLENFGSDIM